MTTIRWAFVSAFAALSLFTSPPKKYSSGLAFRQRLGFHDKGHHCIIDRPQEILSARVSTSGTNSGLRSSMPQKQATNAPLFAVVKTAKISISTAERLDNSSCLLTSAILKISYDGSRYFGWSAANHNSDDSARNDDAYPDYSPQAYDDMHRGSSRSRRRRGMRSAVDLTDSQSDHRSTAYGKRTRRPVRIRTVEGTVKQCVAKLYGNVDTNLVGVVGCSRTDKGVHSKSTIAQIYCHKNGVDYPLNVTKVNGEQNGGGTDQRRNKINRNPLCNSQTPLDAEYVPLPFDGDLNKLCYVLNRMLPFDIRVQNVSPTPQCQGGDVFHPTTCALTKTYRYTFSAPCSENDNARHDPLRWRHVWNIVDSSTSPKFAMFDVGRAQRVANLLIGSHNFSAFCGSCRGKDGRSVQKNFSPICTISRLCVRMERNNDRMDGMTTPNILLHQEQAEITKSDAIPATFGLKPTFTVDITGNRFLYKMCRYIVGMVAAAGNGQVDLDDVTFALEQGRWNSKIFLECAPPHGLVLYDVYYGDQWNFDWLDA